MNAENMHGTSLKQKVAHEFEEFAAIFLYLAFFFCALTTYTMLLLRDFNVSYSNYGFALINALVIAKVILIGEYAHLGKKHETKPLLQSAVYKAFLFTLLVFGFHVLEEFVSLLFHKKDMVGAFHGVRVDDLLGRSLVVFCTFITLFAFRELQRVLGEDSLRSLFLKTGATPKSDRS
jgi:hypothetical protein